MNNELVETIRIVTLSTAGVVALSYLLIIYVTNKAKKIEEEHIKKELEIYYDEYHEESHDLKMITDNKNTETKGDKIND